LVEKTHTEQRFSIEHPCTPYETNGPNQADGGHYIRVGAKRKINRAALPSAAA
jgi:hypothetical protein